MSVISAAINELIDFQGIKTARSQGLINIGNKSGSSKLLVSHGIIVTDFDKADHQKNDDHKRVDW